MNTGRWYPTVLTLPDGNSLVASGSYFEPRVGSNTNQQVPQIRRNGSFASIQNAPFPLDLYPKMHVASDGLIYHTSLVETWSLDVAGSGNWTNIPNLRRNNMLNDYAPSVLYDTDKIFFAGGGTPPTANAETLDLTLSPAMRRWNQIAPMTFSRRQHNATILPDGTVLVTGGTRGTGPTNSDQSFNNLDPGQPVHIPELWDPKTENWTSLAPEQTDRCYHGVAVLLLDGRVLSSGGGEFILANRNANNSQDSHLDAQIFSPPYLFKGQRPVITSTPDSVRYGTAFKIDTPQPDQVSKISLIGLSSVTHSWNTGQRLTFLVPKVEEGVLTTIAPANANICPPGYYMLFLLNAKDVPSVAKIVRVSGGPPAIRSALVSQEASHTIVDAFALRTSIRAKANGTKVEIGITSSCPYGLSACWGGAHEALNGLDGVELVDPIPNGSTSTAIVHMKNNSLPNVNRWYEQFEEHVGQTYELRGFEVTVTGTVEARSHKIWLFSEGFRPEVELIALKPDGKVQWDSVTRRPATIKPSEATAYGTLKKLAVTGSTKSVAVTGPLSQSKTGYQIHVRLFGQVE
jgi:galactose oxidase